MVESEITCKSNRWATPHQGLWGACAARHCANAALRQSCIQSLSPHEHRCHAARKRDSFERAPAAFGFEAFAANTHGPLQVENGERANEPGQQSAELFLLIGVDELPRI